MLIVQFYFRLSIFMTIINEACEKRLINYGTEIHRISNYAAV